MVKDETRGFGSGNSLWVRGQRFLSNLSFFMIKSLLTNGRVNHEPGQESQPVNLLKGVVGKILMLYKACVNRDNVLNFNENVKYMEKS